VVLGVLIGVTFTTTLSFHLQWCAALSSGLEAGEGRVVRMPAAIHLSAPEQHLDNQRCLCGKELEMLELRVVARRTSPVDVSSIATDNLPVVVRDGVGNHTARPMASPLHRSRNPITGALVVGVISRMGRPEWVESVYETWGQDADQLVVFVGENFNFTHPSGRGLPLVRLPDGGNMIMSAVQYLSEHYLGSHHWFVLAMDNSYLRVERLQTLLGQLDPSNMLFLGRSAAGRKDQVPQLGLKEHERYCLGSSGIVLSSALLSELKGHFAECAFSGIPEDVGLGKCVSANLGIQCTQSDKV
jgi:hypothetical protein